MLRQQLSKALAKGWCKTINRQKHWAQPGVKTPLYGLSLQGLYMSEQNKTKLQKINILPETITQLRKVAFDPMLKHYDDISFKTSLDFEERYRIKGTSSPKTRKEKFVILSPEAVREYAKVIDNYAEHPSDPNNNNEDFIFLSAMSCVRFKELPVFSEHSVYIANLSNNERFEVALKLLKKGIALGYVYCLYFFCILCLIIDEAYAEDVDMYIKMLMQTDCKDIDALLRLRLIFTPNPDYLQPQSSRALAEGWC